MKRYRISPLVYPQMYVYSVITFSLFLTHTHTHTYTHTHTHTHTHTTGYLWTFSRRLVSALSWSLHLATTQEHRK